MKSINFLGFGMIFCHLMPLFLHRKVSKHLSSEEPKPNFQRTLKKKKQTMKNFVVQSHYGANI